MKYSFEKVSGQDTYQVRLKGEFVCFVPIRDSKLVDQILKSNGFETREDFFNHCITEHVE